MNAGGLADSPDWPCPDTSALAQSIQPEANHGMEMALWAGCTMLHVLKAHTRWQLDRQEKHELWLAPSA